MNFKNAIACSIIGLLFLVSCQSRFHVFSTQTKSIHPNRHTFTVAKDENLVRLLGYQKVNAIEEEIKKQMRARGFIWTDQAPDLVLFVTYYTQRAKLPELEQIHRAEEKAVSIVFKKMGTNTLLLQLLETESNNIIWRSLASHLPNETESRQYIHMMKWLFSELQYEKVTYENEVTSVARRSR